MKFDRNIKKTLDQAATHLIIGAVEIVRANPNLPRPAVEVFLRPVSPEALPVLSLKEDWLYARNDIGHPYYLAYDSDFFNLLRREDLNEATLEEREEFLKEYLQGYLVVFRPRYEWSEEKGQFYMRFTPMEASVGNVMRFKAPESFSSYQIVPKLSSVNSIRNFEAGKPTSLRGWNVDVFGVPEYLEYGEKILCGSIVKENAKSIRWEKEKPSSSVTIKNLSDPLYIATAEDYDFVETTSLLSLFLEVKKEEKNKPILATVPVHPAENPVMEETTEENAVLKQFYDYMMEKNYDYSASDINNFHACLKSGVMTILAGMSGTGKTRLPLEYCDFFGLTEKDHTLLFLPISPSDNEPEDLLGFYNPASELYIPSPGGLVEFLVHAQKHPDLPHMVLLEEMNLSQIEHYFAPFLSILERDAGDRKLRLYSDSVRCRNGEEFPPIVDISQNVLFVGTINIDETTTRLSDRLLDRSFVVNLDKQTFAQYRDNTGKNLPSQEELPSSPDVLSRLFVSKDPHLSDNYIQSFTPRQIEFFDTLHALFRRNDSTKGVSFRCVKNIALYLNSCPKSGTFTPKMAFDYAIKQTILRKVRGSQDQLSLLLAEEGGLVDLFHSYSDISSFEKCLKDVESKRNQLRLYGFVH